MTHQAQVIYEGFTHFAPCYDSANQELYLAQAQYDYAAAKPCGNWQSQEYFRFARDRLNMARVILHSIATQRAEA